MNHHPPGNVRGSNLKDPGPGGWLLVVKGRCRRILYVILAACDECIEPGPVSSRVNGPVLPVRVLDSSVGSASSPQVVGMTREEKRSGVIPAMGRLESSFFRDFRHLDTPESDSGPV